MLSFDDIQSKSQKFLFIKEFIKNESNNKIYFISLGSIEINKLKQLKNSIFENDSKIQTHEIINSTELNKCKNEGNSKGTING